MIFLSLFILLFSLVIHEVSHAYAALYFGDDTAKKLGRLSLNPVRHLDIIGSIVVPLSLFFFQSSFLFGWAKPVPVDFFALKPYKKAVFWVSFAGPLSNFVLAFFSLGSLLFFHLSPGLLFSFCLLSFYLNVILFVFNLLPFPPLDGFKILSLFLPSRVSSVLLQYEKWGLGLFFIAFYFSLFDWIFTLPSHLFAFSQSIFSMQL